MIQNLLQQFISRLRTDLAGVLANPVQDVVVGPLSSIPPNQTPKIALEPGDAKFLTELVDGRSSEVRPQANKEVISVDGVTPQGPYPLAQVPLKGSALSRLVLDVGTVDERGLLLQENKDFTIDYAAPAISFSTDISSGDEFELSYNFPGIFTYRDFEQEFFLDVIADGWPEGENLASLALTIFLTQYSESLQDFNEDNPTTYSSGNYFSRHRIKQVDFMKVEEGNEEYGGNDFWRRRMVFQVKGSLHSIRTDNSGFGLIEKVRSPGADSSHAIDIRPELG